MTARNTGDMPHVDMIAIDEDTVRYGGSFFRRERTCLAIDEGGHLEGTDCPARTCSACGGEFEAGAAYCSNCGARVVDE